MKTLFRSLLLCTIILLPVLSTAQNSGDSKSETVDQVFEEIPIEERLGEAPQKMQGLISQNPFGLQPSQNELMMDAFKKSFAQDSLLDYTREAFNQNFEAEAADAVLQWFQNQNTQTVLDAEMEFYTIEGIRKRVVNKYEMEQNPPPQNRIELINSLSEKMSAVESEIESQVIIFRALVFAFSELSSQRSLSDVQVEGIVNNYRLQIQSQTDQEITNQLLTLYHGLDNDKLQKQISFYETDAGKWLSNTISESIHSAYETAGDKFLNSIEEL